MATSSSARKHVLLCTTEDFANGTIRPGAFAISLGLPLVCYLATFLCNDISGCPVPSLLHPTSLTLSKLKEETGWPGITGLGSFEVTAYVLAYYLTSMVLLTVLPGVESQGVELTSGGRLPYKLNGKRSEAACTGYMVDCL